MTLAALTRAGTPVLSHSLSEAAYKMILRFEDYRQFRRTVAKLRDLSDDQLADLAIPRCGIIATAREAVYGTAD